VSIVTDTLVETIKEKVAVTVVYKDLIATAKTNTKKEYYKKKLKKHNVGIADLLVALDRMSDGT
jgi:hypothetical protein